jgi:hypothetical protein
MGSGGAYSVSGSMNNPAIEIEVSSGGRSVSGWLFLLYPRFNSRFDLPVTLGLLDVEPVFYTGLQISTNPGANIFLAGITIASVGVCLMYMFHYRHVKGVLTAERISIAGAGYRWKLSFEREFEKIEKALAGELSREIAGKRDVSDT